MIDLNVEDLDELILKATNDAVKENISLITGTFVKALGSASNLTTQVNIEMLTAGVIAAVQSSIRLSTMNTICVLRILGQIDLDIEFLHLV